ncbi:hypothetical protein DM860_006809 [Cuscuta australis]|uniref:Uncharacterized protein n=1 Tax=Cuscuta australis TaxID=267555 RepID=A0A328E5B8_9ASTE|nr:hypothetical protein DM860_006809 [Cuscuta australis]
MVGVDHIKRSMLPKKICDGWKMVSHAHVPRKLRSAIKKRNGAPISLPFLGNGKHKKSEKKSELNLGEEKHKDVMGSKISEDEQEVAEALFALAGLAASSICSLNAEGSEPSSNAEETLKFQTPSDDQLHRFIPTDLNVDSNGVAGDGSKLYGNNTFIAQRTQTSKSIAEKESWKRSCTHVYVSRLIKVLQRSNGTLADELLYQSTPQTSVSKQILLPPPYSAVPPRQGELQNWPTHFLPAPYKVVGASHILEWQNVGQNGHSLPQSAPKFLSPHYSLHPLQQLQSGTMARGQYCHLPDDGFDGNGLPGGLYHSSIPALQMLGNGHH